MDRKNIPIRVLELQFEGRVSRTTRFSHLMKDSNKSGKSWQEMRKERLLGIKRRLETFQPFICMKRK
jgi:hypothetical protein